MPFPFWRGKKKWRLKNSNVCPYQTVWLMGDSYLPHYKSIRKSSRTLTKWFHPVHHILGVLTSVLYTAICVGWMTSSNLTRYVGFVRTAHTPTLQDENWLWILNCKPLELRLPLSVVYRVVSVQMTMDIS